MPAADSKSRFSSRVADYIRYRPHYPRDVMDHLTGRFGLTPAQTVADIGSGTGILTEMFLRNGNPVVGVEPNREMREAAERLLASYPRFRSIAAAAEATTLPDASIDWVTAGQAFHWFDGPRCRVEFQRILRPGGRVALLWNNRREGTPFLAEYERLLHEFGTDYAAIKHQNAESDGRIEQFFGDAPFDLAVFPNRQVFDYDGLQGRTMSASYVPAPGQPGFDPMIATLRRLYDAHQSAGNVAFDYETRLYVGRLT